MIGKTLKGVDDGHKWQEFYIPDKKKKLKGSIAGRWDGEPYRGKWSIKGDLMCFDYQGTEDDGCWHIALSDENDVLWFKEDGTPDGDSEFVESPKQLELLVSQTIIKCE